MHRGQSATQHIRLQRSDCRAGVWNYAAYTEGHSGRNRARRYAYRPVPVHRQHFGATRPSSVLSCTGENIKELTWARPTLEAQTVQRTRKTGLQGHWGPFSNKRETRSNAGAPGAKISPPLGTVPSIALHPHPRSRRTVMPREQRTKAARNSKEQNASSFLLVRGDSHTLACRRRKGVRKKRERELVVSSDNYPRRVLCQSVCEKGARSFFVMLPFFVVFCVPA